MPPGEIASGRVIFAGEGWLRKTRREMRAVRDKRTPIARSLAVGLELVSARDLSLIRRISDRPAVVCVGTLVETGTLKQILHAP
jgi:ABC-type glutathione transport system ATPase component